MNQSRPRPASAIRLAIRAALLPTLLGVGAPQALALDSEKPGLAELMAPDYRDDAERTFWSYAQVTDVAARGCSGVLIGPNVVMTAAHCGHGPNHWVRYRTYRDQDPTQEEFDDQMWSCEFILQTLPSGTDINLVYCPTLAGLPPGVRYGYLDLEDRPANLGEPLLSYWYNSVDDQGLGWALLYSEGQVVAPAPGYLSGLGLEVDVWGREGASGSVMVDPETYRILIGPTSMGTKDAAGKPFRIAAEISDYLCCAPVDASDPIQVNAPLLSSLGLAAMDYNGILDQDGDGLIDAVADLERLAGEARRDLFWLGFDSARRNALWSADPNLVSFEVDREIAAITMPYPLAVPLVHERLDLEPDTPYRLSFRVRALAGKLQSLRVGLRSDDATVSSGLVKPSIGGGWNRYNVRLRSGPGQPTLFLETDEASAAKIELAEVVLHREGALIDFDTHDIRLMWEDPEGGTRALIVPDGTDGGTDWAGRVDPAARNESGWNTRLGSDDLAIIPGEATEICFAHRAAGNGPPTGDWGKVEVRSKGAKVAERAFRPQATWGMACVGPFKAPHSETRVDFSTRNNGYGPPTSLLIDDIELIGAGSGALPGGGGPD